MVVPPDIDGEGVAISRSGGVWDVMKRTLSWSIPELPAGKVIDIQAQFRCSGGPQSQRPPASSSKFPVLVRCSGDASFSKIELDADYTEEGSIPVDLRVQKEARVICRKV